MDIGQALKILGLKCEASQKDIKQTYRDLAQVWHPDKFTHNPRLQKICEKKLKEINEAYEILKEYTPQNHSQKSSPHQTPYRKNPKPPPPSPWDKVGINYVAIPSGSFSMGSNNGGSNEKPVHTVTVSGFEMGIYEITQGQYMAIIGALKTYFSLLKWKGDNLPIEGVSWFDAINYCNALSDNAGLNKCYNKISGECDFTENGFRLPTEAEWEYACRAGSTTTYNLGDTISDLERAGWYSKNSGSKTHPVGQKEPNAWGLYDMHGNVGEWCNDGYEYYTSSSAKNPRGRELNRSALAWLICPIWDPRLVVRGGYFFSDATSCRSTCRGYWYRENRNSSIGFRVVRRIAS